MSETETPEPLPVFADPLASGGRVVVGVDSSPYALTALRWALREAVVRSAVLEVVHAWQPPVAALPFGATLALTSDDAEIDATARDHMETVVQEALAELANEHPERDVPEVMRTVMPGAAAMTLVDVAKDADLLVVGSHGHTGLRKFVLGSVALACVQHAACPVAVVRRPDE